LRVEKLRAESDLEESELYESCRTELKQLRCEHLKWETNWSRPSKKWWNWKGNRTIKK